jgi:hypothetical protein
MLERCPFIHIDDDLKLALVVVRQHLDLDAAGREQADRGHEEEADRNQKGDAQQGPSDHRAHDPPIGACRRVLPVHDLSAAPGMPTEHAIGRPRRHHEGDGHGEQHRRRRADRDGPHVGPHESLHECHGQHRRDDGQGRENQGTTDLVDGLHRHILERSAAVLEEDENGGPRFPRPRSGRPPECRSRR